MNLAILFVRTLQIADLDFPLDSTHNSGEALLQRARARDMARVMRSLVAWMVKHLGWAMSCRAKAV